MQKSKMNLNTPTKQITFTRRILKILKVTIPNFGRTKEWIENNRSKAGQWIKENAQAARTRSLNWNIQNPDKAYAKHRRYLNRLRAGTPVDLTATELGAIAKMYEKAKALTGITGTKYEVDHIKPLIKGGLHVLENIQVLTAYENKIKATKETK